MDGTISISKGVLRCVVPPLCIVLRKLELPEGPVYSLQ